MAPITSSTSYSGSKILPERLQALCRGNDVIRAGQRPREAGELVRRAIPASDHALEHVRQRALVAAETYEDRPVTLQRAVRDIPAKDPPEPILVGASDVRGFRFGLKFDAIGLASTDDCLLGGDG